MKYLNLESEGQLGLSEKVYENADFEKSLLRTEINLGYVGAGKSEGIGLIEAVKILEDSSRCINHDKCTLSIKVDVNTYTKTYYKIVRDENGERVSSIELVSFNYVTGESINVPDITRTKKCSGHLFKRSNAETLWVQVRWLDEERASDKMDLSSSVETCTRARKQAKRSVRTDEGHRVSPLRTS